MSPRTETECALAAMNRAAARARIRASRFGSRLAVWRNGAVVLLDPRGTGAEQAGADQPAAAPEPKPEGKENTRPDPEAHPR